MRKLTIAISLLFGLVFVPAAHAHISLEQGGTQKSRYGDAAIKQGPCGMTGGTRGTNIYTYEPGETITVKLVEYVAHPGYFRFAFDDDGDDAFQDPVSIAPLDPDRGCPASVLTGDAAARDQCTHSDFYNTPAVLPDMDNLEDHLKIPAGKLYTFQVKLPDVECDNCTLQVIQVMEDPVHGPYNLEVSGAGDLGDVYHQCIDLVLKKGASQDSDAGVTDSGAADGGASAGKGGAGASAGKGGASATASAGKSGSASAGKGGNNAATAPDSGVAPAAAKDSGGCSVRGVTAGQRGSWSAGLWLLGAVWLMRKRRRQS
jgi:hypothetical protein